MEELIPEEDYVPRPPETEQEQVEWAGVPEEDFSNPSLWLHRTLLKRDYQISERSYFRWLKGLRAYGLVRYLPALTDWKVKLFYKPDVEAAVALYLSEHQRRRHRPQNVETAKEETAKKIEPPPTVEPTPAKEAERESVQKHEIQDPLEARMLGLIERLEQLQTERLAELREINERFRQMSADQEALRLSIEALREQLERTTPAHSEGAGGADFFAKALQIIADMAKTHEAAILATTGRLTIDLAPLKAILKKAEELSLPKKTKQRR